MSPGYRRPGADSDNSLYPDREPCDIIGVARCDDRKDRDMDQAQLLSLIGSLYDKLVEDVAQRVATMNKESLAYLVDASVTESIDARVKAVVEDDFANLFRRVAAIEDKGIHANLVTEVIDARIQTWAGYNLSDAIATWVENNLDLDDRIENWVENNLDLEDAAREAVSEIDLGDSVREIIKNELTFSVSVD
jgi:hypothetical protein